MTQDRASNEAERTLTLVLPIEDWAGLEAEASKNGWSIEEEIAADVRYHRGGRLIQEYKNSHLIQ